MRAAVPRERKPLENCNKNEQNVLIKRKTLFCFFFFFMSGARETFQSEKSKRKKMQMRSTRKFP